MSRQQQTQQTRRFDHLYDPTYTCSAERDHARITTRSQTRAVDRVPDRANLFSEIPSVYKSHEIRLRTKSDLPGHVSTLYRGVANDAEAVRMASSSAAVSGKHRHKYFRRPVVPILHSAPPEILLATHDGKQQAQLQQAGAGEREAERRKSYEAEVVEEVDGQVTQGTQTHLRESEAQTDPYTPEYFIPAGADPEPEILELAGLKFGKGLPITQEEVNMIERARFKKAFLASLPPITDEASFNLRKRMMEEQELREFKYREDEINRQQQEHLRLLKEALDEREAEAEYLSEQRLTAMRQQKVQEKDDKLLAIQKQRVKQLRKLARARAGVYPEKSSYEVVDAYSNFASKTYAPLLRDGVFDPSKIGPQESSWAALPSDLENFMRLEAAVDPRQLSAKPRAASAVPANGEGHGLAAGRKRQQLVQHLEWMDALIRARKGGAEAADGKLGAEGSEGEDSRTPLWRKRAEKLERPPTPRIARAESEAAAGPEAALARRATHAAALLQRLVRGRAIQTMMVEGKTKRLELIRELRTEEIAAQGQAAAASSASAPSQRDPGPTVRDDAHGGAGEDAERAAASDAVQGEVVSTTLDLLAKELTHIEQERKVHALAEAAIEKRRRREMIQSGTRQAEDMRRRREDEVYRQLMLVHYGTVDSLFDEILAEGIETAATETALEAIAPGAGSRPSSAAMPTQPHSDKDVVHGLVSSFLLPHVQRESVRMQIEAQERRFVEAAHRSISEVLATFGDDGSRQDEDADAA